LLVLHAVFLGDTLGSHKSTFYICARKIQASSQLGSLNAVRYELERGPPFLSRLFDPEFKSIEFVLLLKIERPFRTVCGLMLKVLVPRWQLPGVRPRTRNQATRTDPVFARRACVSC